MNIFNKKSNNETNFDKPIKELCGGTLSSKKFKVKLEEHNLKFNTPNLNYKKVLKYELENQTLTIDNLENRLDELMELDVDTLWGEFVLAKFDSSVIHTQADLQPNLEQNQSIKQQEKDEKEQARKQKIEDDKIARQEKLDKELKELDEKRRIQKEEFKKHREQLKKENEERQNKIKEDKKQMYLDTYGYAEVDGEVVFNNPPEDQNSTFDFNCGIREERFGITNKERADLRSVSGTIYNDYFEFKKTGFWIKSNLGERKVYFRNIISVDYDKAGIFHLTTSVVVRMRDGEQISLEAARGLKALYTFLHVKWEMYQEEQDNNSGTPISKADELLKFTQLYEKGVLTKEELNEKKKELL